MAANKLKSKLKFSSSLVLAGLLSLVGCGGSSDSLEPANKEKPSSTTEDSNREDVLTLLAGSELKDIEPFFSDIKQQTGIELKLEYTGTIDGVNRISQGSDVDAAWFSHGKYLSLVNRDKIKAQTPIMLSPVVMGIKQSKANALGWLTATGTVKSDITWDTIADAAKSGKLKYAMTNPAASNSGFTSLMGVTSAFSGSSDAPTAEDIAKAKPRLKDFFRGQALTSGSSGWLAEAYVDQQAELDAIINYESVLMQLNQNNQLDEPLVLVFPTEGIVTADYPLTLLNFDKKESYDKVVAYLKSEEMQRRIMKETNRRPVNNKISLSDDFYSGLLVELPFPNSSQLIDSLLLDFANELRNPAFSLFVLDTSGSMQGGGIEQLKQALNNLASDADSSTESALIYGSSRFTKFAKNEVVGIKPFNHDSYPLQKYIINDQNLASLKQQVNSLTAGGGTAIYYALSDSYDDIYQEMQKHNQLRLQAQQANDGQDIPPYYYNIVLMTDGVNEADSDLQDFINTYNTAPSELRNIKVFVVLFGDADETEMSQIAELTGGKVFDGRDANLTDVFRKIRGYQ